MQLEVGYAAKEVVDINGSYLDPLERPHHIFRNTFIGSSKYTSVDDTSEYCYETHNVFVTTISNNYTSNNVTDFSKIVQVDNLVNATTDHFLDKTTGLLIESFSSLNNTRGANGMAGLK